MGLDNFNIRDEIVRIPALQLVEQLTLVMQLLYGATTLRTMYKRECERAAPGRAGKIRLGAQKQPLRRKFRVFGIMQKHAFCIQNLDFGVSCQPLRVHV